MVMLTVASLEEVKKKKKTILRFLDVFLAVCIHKSGDISSQPMTPVENDNKNADVYCKYAVLFAS